MPNRKYTTLKIRVFTFVFSALVTISFSSHAQISGPAIVCAGVAHDYVSVDQPDGSSLRLLWSVDGGYSSISSPNNYTKRITWTSDGSVTLTQQEREGQESWVTVTTYTIDVKVAQTPTVSATPKQIALGQSTTLKATGSPYSYSWSGSGLSSNTTGVSLQVTPTVAGQAVYSASSLLSTGETCSGTGTVTVNIFQPVNAGPDLTYCKEAGSINLSDWGLDLATGSWTGQAIVNNSIDLTQLAQGNYTYTYVRAADGSSDAMILTVQQSVSGSLNVQTTSSCGTLTGTLSLSGLDGSILYWEHSYDNGANWTQINSQSASYTYSESQNTLFRAAVQKGSCSIAYTSPISVTQIDPIAGAISSNGVTQGCDVVTGSLTLSGSNGTVKFWEKSYDNGNSWSNISNSATSTLVGISENQAVQYRAGSQKDNCAVVYTAPYSLAPLHTVGGNLSVSSEQINCGNSSGMLVLQNYSGDKLTWQTGNGNTWTDITDVNGNSYTFNVASDASFRVKVEWQSAACVPQYSNVYSVTASSKGGTAVNNSPATQCGTASGNIYLSDFVGSITQWETSADGTTWQPVANSTGKMPLQFSTSNPLTYYRASVQLGSCPIQYSTAVSVFASSPTVPGKVKFIKEDPVATQNADGTYTFHPVFQLQSYIGQVQTWWKFEGSGSNLKQTSYPSTGETITPTLTQTAAFRAEVKDGGCDALLSGQSTFVVNAPFAGTINILRYTVSQTYDGHSYKISSSDGMSLRDGFTFIANSSQNFFVIEDDNYSQPQIDKNFVLEETILKEGVTDDGDVYFLNAPDKASSYVYADGLGRPSQQVHRRNSPNQKDVVVPIVYDADDRQVKDYLPYEAGNSNGYFQDNAVVNQASFYLMPPAKTAGTQYPFAVKVFEPSPLNRVLEQGAPGTDWQPVIGHTVKYVSTPNDGGEVIFWMIDEATQRPIINGYYNAGELFARTTTDEHNNKVKEYTDKRGLALMKRVQKDAEWIDTYYIYDDLNLLRFVLQPEGVAQLPSMQNSATPLDQTFLEMWAFQYKYDQRHRMVEKKVPGGGLMYMVYDLRDRAVLTQDANQRTKNQWTFTKYDQLNRPVMTGIYTYNDPADATHIASRAEINGMVSTTVFAETFDGSSPYGYTTTNTFPSENIEPLTVTYYDNYDFISLMSGFGYDASAISGLPAQPFSRVNGLVTGMQTKILNTDTWLKSVTWYDDKYRLMQTLSSNHLNGTDRASMLLDFSGKVLVKTTTHIKDQSAPIVIKEEFNYDHTGRLLAQYHQIGDGPKVNLKEQNYNALGQLVEKNLYLKDDGTYQQSVDYRYNIRGWLTHINNAALTNDGGQTNDDGSDYFGFELKYDNPSLVGGAAQFNGNISESQWTTTGNTKQSYAYSYDAVNRLTQAKYLDWVNPLNNDRFNEVITSYDRNGNIFGLQRGRPSNLMDDLGYKYFGNRLLNVTDNGDKVNGFVEGSNTEDDYAYDTNGNMVTDQNKLLTATDAIQYNHLNLPSVVTRNTNEKVVYIYDASGRKLRQKVHDVLGNIKKVTDYDGSFIYQGDTLQFINHDEGRVVTKNGDKEYQYHLKDHLGNVRLTFTTQSKPQSNTATFESVNYNEEQNKFLRYSDARLVNSDLFDHTRNGQTAYSERLSGSANEKTGVARSISVMPGDTIKMEVFAKYVDASNPKNSDALLNLLSQIMTGPAGTVIDGTNYVTNGTTPFPYTGLAGEGNDTGDGPKAYLNYIMFDKNFVPIHDQSQTNFVRMTNFAKEEGLNSPNGVPHEHLFAQVIAKQAGYMYIYLSNEEDTPVDVFFDDFNVTQSGTPIMQKEDFYPFGLSFNSETRENTVPQNFLYNGKELQNDLSLDWYDYGARMYMPEIGRWGVVDPLSEKMRRHSPYNYAFDNPIRFIDSDGMAPTDWFQSESGKAIWRDSKAESVTENGVEYKNIGTTHTIEGESLSIKYEQDVPVEVTEKALSTDSFSSQMKSATGKKDGTEGNCYTQANAMAKESGAQPITGEVNGINAKQSPSEGKNYVDSQISQGKATVVGVDRSTSTQKLDGKTDHYVTISSRTTDLKSGAQTYGFFDPGSFTKAAGTSTSVNKFSVGSNGQLSSGYYNTNGKYNVTWVGRNQSQTPNQ